jgi:hypothetical protein
MNSPSFYLNQDPHVEMTRNLSKVANDSISLKVEIVALEAAIFNVKSKSKE